MRGLAHSISRLNPTKRWITALALLAFIAQSLTLPTHIHQAQPAAAKASRLATGDGSKGPLKLDPIDQCRLCQEVAHAGTFIAPTAAATPANLTFVAASFAVLLAVATDPATAFAWRSRAPPVR